MKTAIAVVVVAMLVVSAVAAPAVFASPQGKSFNLNLVSNAVCPVDGNQVSVTTSEQTTYGGRKIGFCSAGCKQKFMANPNNYSGNL
jgi:YHS domain-containing protein